MQIAFVLNGARLLARIARMHLGQEWLAPLERISYLPIVLAHALLLALWLPSGRKR
jgi:hypothetical protein